MKSKNMNQKTKNALLKIVSIIFAAIYFPIYMTAVILIKILRCLLAIPYLIIGDWRKSRDIIKYLFDKNA